MPMPISRLTNWSNFPIVKRKVFTPQSKIELINNFNSTKTNTFIARGNGRSYGDSSYSQVVVSTLNLNKIIFFNEKEGTIRCESGVLLDNIIELIVPKGFFLPVTPGTKYITIGGAIASDVHGKNHHKEGSFSDYIITLEILNDHGELIILKHGDDLFHQTIGGMGLTGIVTEVEFKLKKIETSYIKAKNIKAKNLEEVIELMIKNSNVTYSVAWIDCLAKGANLGRSILMLGEHAAIKDCNPTQSFKNTYKTHSKPSLKLPFFFPSWFLSPITIQVFNYLYFKINASKKEKVIHFDPYFYPLDSVLNWNKIYGKKGFVEYQFVIPLENALPGIREILEIIVKNKLASFLCVIKLFGENNSNKYLNFPKKGITLGLDLKMTKDIWNILDSLDQIVTKHNGRIYLTKDSRMKSSVFNSQYPEKIIPSSKFKSDQSMRLNQEQLNTYLIIGANSDIAKSYVSLISKKEKDSFFILCSQNVDSLQIFTKEQQIENRSEILYLNLLQDMSFQNFIKNLKTKPKTILYAAGICPDNETVFESQEMIDDMVKVNYTSAIKLLNLLILDYNPFLTKVIGISSIAGIRGRKSNFMYGSTKAAFHQYLFGLRQKLQANSVIVQSVTPGAVKTKMTAHLKLPFFASSPNDIARSIYNAKNKFQIYPNFIWRIISIVVKFAPTKIVSLLK